MSKNIAIREKNTSVNMGHSILPKTKVPQIWSIRCRPHFERKTLEMIIDKIASLSKINIAVDVFSAGCRDDLRGYLFMEAHEFVEIVRVIKDIPTSRSGLSINSARAVPLCDMVSFITPSSKEPENFSIGDWARVKSGSYRGNLCYVTKVIPMKGWAVVKLLTKTDFADDYKHGQNTIVCDSAPRYSSPGRDLEIKNDCVTKRYTLRSLVRVETPTTEEVRAYTSMNASDQHFNNSDIISDKSSSESIIMGPDTSFARARPETKNMVIVKEGETYNAWKIGDLVRIVGGNFKGFTGDIVRINDNYSLVFCLNLHLSVNVLNRDLQPVTMGIRQQPSSTTNPYNLFDLVSLGQDNFGVILHIEKNLYRIMTNNGTPITPELCTVTANKILGKIRDLVSIEKNILKPAKDMYQSKVQIGDFITVVKGPGLGLSGRIRDEYRGFLFVQCRNLNINKGYYCVISTKTRVMGITPPISDPQEFNKKTSKNRKIMLSKHSEQNDKSFGQQDPLLNRKVTILKGPLKNYHGLVTSVYESKFEIEIEALYKKVVISKQNVAEID